MELVECVPNFSEGRRTEVIEAIVAAARSVSGVRILDVHSDGDHNRTVLTYVAPPEAALEAGLAVAREAVQRIDLREHSGEHPRMGALDVCPFIPLGDVAMERCIALARQLGERIADELNVPVFLYEEAATGDERRNLERIRRKGFEELRETIGSEAARRPDFGPSRVHPTAGAVAIGARQFLIAFNVYLATADPALARSIARRIRHSTGGLRYVKALGLEVGGETQVSMNLTNFRGTSIVTVMDVIRAEASRHGVPITRSEVVGLVPLDALLDAALSFLQLEGFSPEQVLERRLWA